MSESEESTDGGVTNSMTTNEQTQFRKGLSKYLGSQYEGDRDLYDALGYEERENVPTEKYFAKYRRQDIATRLVEAAPNTTWKGEPSVEGDGDEESQSEFESDYEDLKDEHRLLYNFRRADILSRIGRFGVMLVGFDDGRELSEPVDEGKIRGLDDILYLSPYGEDRVEEPTLDSDTSSERYGKPESYTVEVGEDGYTEEVHHSRVIHIAENPLDNEVYSRPTLESVLNRLDDLEKVAGGSAEMYWRGAYPGMAFNIDPEFEGGEDALDEFSDSIEEYMHGMKRYMKFRGTEVEQLSSEMEDPSPLINAYIELLASAKNIPQRILMGSERGELASSQDIRNWYSRISERRTNFAEPVIVRPLVNLLVKVGALTAPTDDSYSVVWPALYEEDQNDKATIQQTRANALTQFASTLELPEQAKLEYMKTGELPDEVDEPASTPESPEEAPAEEGENVDVAATVHGIEEQAWKESFNAEEDELDAVFKEFMSLMNLQPSQLKKRKENETYTGFGVDADRAIESSIALRDKNKADWTVDDVSEAKRHIAFITEMLQNRPADEHMNPGEWTGMLKNMGHDPFGKA